MSDADIWISESVRQELRSHLLEERDLLENVRRQQMTAAPGLPGTYTCACTVAVRRPLDPETAELCRVEVTLQRMETGWLISAVDGLSGGIDGESG